VAAESAFAILQSMGMVAAVAANKEEVWRGANAAGDEVARWWAGDYGEPVKNWWNGDYGQPITSWWGGTETPVANWWGQVTHQNEDHGHRD
jgi:hypothetical protein